MTAKPLIPLTIAETLMRAAQIADCCAARAEDADLEGAFPAQEFRWLTEAGLLAAALRPDLGGPGLGSLPGTTPDLLTLLRHIGRGSLPVGRLYEGHVNALLLVQRYGSLAQQMRWAADVHEEHRLFSVWSTQSTDGVHLLPLGNGRYHLQGAKTFASGAQHIARPLITAELPDGGWQMVIVPTEQTAAAVPDASFWQPLGMRSTISVHMDFSGLEVSTDDFLGEPGDYFRQPGFSGGGVRFMAVQVGGAQALLEATRNFVRAQGRAEDPFVRERAGRMAALIESGNHWLRRTGKLLDCPDMDAKAMVEYSHLARAMVEEACLEVVRLADRTAGARGMLRPHPFERLHRDLTLYLRQGGADAALVEAGAYLLESARSADDLWRPTYDCHAD
jgi:alkylation response protein AidB-like acyl-CoA dehydrogenase